MQKKAVVAALITALLAAATLSLCMQQLEEQALGGQPVVLLVATRDVAAGETLTREMLAERVTPEAYAGSRAVRATDATRVLGVRVVVPQNVGEPLLWTDLAGMTARKTSLSELVQSGMRAFTLNASCGTFGGLLEPGDRVDVLGPDRDGSYAPLVENAVVIAIGDRVQTRVASADAAEVRDERDADEVTLRVTPDQAGILASTSRDAGLRLALRSPSDVLLVRPAASSAAR